MALLMTIVFLYLHLLTFSEQLTVVNALKCHTVLTIIEEGVIKPSGYLVAGDGGKHRFPPNYFEALNKTHYRTCICEVVKCIRVCPDSTSESINGTFSSEDVALPDFQFRDEKGTVIADVTINDFLQLKGDTCFYGMSYSIHDDFYLTENGTLRFYETYSNENYEYGAVDYCIAFDVFEDEILTYVLVCVDHMDMVNPIGTMISIPFLVLTFLVYVSIPELRNTHGKTLMSYIMAVTINCIATVVIFIKAAMLDLDTCLIIGAVLHNSFLSAFFWLNVMSFDIWSTFRVHEKVQNESKTFAYYSLYAWGVPLIFTCLMLVANFVPNASDYLPQPKLCTEENLIGDERAKVIYFRLPVNVIFTANTILFLLTSRTLYIFRKGVGSIKDAENHKTSEHRNMFFLLLKLCLLMGMNWVLEMVSTPLGFKYFIIPRAFQGILIFILFVCNTRIKNLVIGKFKSISSSFTRTFNTSTRSGRSR